MPLQVLLSESLNSRLHEAAKTSKRSKNAEIVFRLECSFQEKGPAEAATSPSRVTENLRGNPMMDKHSTASGMAARPCCRDDETPALPDVIDQLYRVIHLTELTFMATESMEADRLKSAFAVALDHIGDELRGAKAALEEILRVECERGGRA